MNELDSRTIRRIAAIQSALAIGMTANELAAAIHAVPQSALEYIRHLRDVTNRRIYIESWRRTPSHIFAVYRWGNLKDARKPRAMTAVESQRQRMKRLRKDGDAYERHLATDRARYARNKAVKTPKTWLSALGVA